MPHDFKDGESGLLIFLAFVSSLEEWDSMTWAFPSELLGHSHAFRKHSGPHWLRARLPVVDAQDWWLEGRPTLIGRWTRKETNPCHQGGSWYFRRLKTASMMRLDLLSESRPVPIGGTHQMKGSGRMLKINLVQSLGALGGGGGNAFLSGLCIN